jgi:hypothetical protein
VRNADIAPDAVTGAKIFDGTIGLLDMGANSVDAGVLADNSVDSAAIVNGTIGNGDLGNQAVQTSNIADNAVTGTQIASGSVQQGDLAGGSVGSSELQDNAVRSNNIASSGVDYVDIAADAVRNATIQDNAVTGNKVQDGSLTSADVGIANGFVDVAYADIPAGTCALQTPAVAGTQANDHVILNLATPAINDHLDYDALTPGSAGQLRIRLCNRDATNPVLGATLRFYYVVIR